MRDEVEENQVTYQVTWHDQTPAHLLVITGQWLENTNPLLALQYYEAALAIDPQLSIAAWRYGHLAWKQNQPEKAREKLEASLAFCHDHAPTYYCLSLLREEQEDDEAALKYVNQALAINPLHSGAYLQKLRLSAKMQLWTELQELLDDTIPNLENAGEILLYRVLSQIHLGHKAEAKVAYQSVLPKHRHRFPQLVKRIDAELAI